MRFIVDLGEVKKLTEDFMAHDIGALIREMRKAAGMSQMRLADKIGVSYQQIQKYEKGASKLNIPRLRQIADVFGVPITAFLEDATKMNKAAEAQAMYSNLSEEEARMLMLFRRLRRKKLRDSFVEMLRDIVKLQENK